MIEKEAALAGFRVLAAELLDVDASAIVDGANLVDDLGADSLDLVEILFAVEDRVGVELPIEKFLGVTTVGDAIDRMLECLVQV